jgi:hypothetical protein
MCLEGTEVFGEKTEADPYFERLLCGEGVTGGQREIAGVQLAGCGSCWGEVVMGWRKDERGTFLAPDPGCPHG